MYKLPFPISLYQLNCELCHVNISNLSQFSSISLAMMTLNYFNQFQFENTYYINFNSIQFQITCLIVGLLQVLLLNIFTNRKKIHNIFLGFHSSIQTHLISSKSPKNQKENKIQHSVSRGDLEIVLRNLGLFRNFDKLPASIDANDIYTIFDEKNPSLDEVKEAFDMFDKNKDGFIEAGELQMVLCALGLQEGLDMENCRKMIGVFNKDGDEKMDFEDFVKFMEISLS